MSVDDVDKRNIYNRRSSKSLLISPNSAIKVFEFEKKSLKVDIHDFKTEDKLQKLCKKLRIDTTGTKQQLTTRAERKLNLKGATNIPVYNY